MSKDISPELLDFLDKFVDRQCNANTEIAHKLAIIETYMNSTDTNIKHIEDKFNNGFRSELKLHMDNHAKGFNKRLDILDKRTERLTTLGFWLRNITLLVGSIAGIITGMIYLMK